ncbi:YigZ family protein [Saccharobesus litoralis]|uniref:YigZ family protein n=1 Tax=Saccharobesus litoralis TaxID=2172099 RepID=A0A2S0VQS8_9ALTE|nr:YigZ family protein [Saccharobesus litoralis]AWB66549.1 YigZ family protein [Saccharobesus litoralis]
MSQYLVPAATCEVEETIKKSRFITRLIPVQNSQQAKQIIAEIKQEFKDARHHCSAFVAGAPHDSNQYGFSDDGEPSGTAGKPMLAVLQGSGLGHVLAVVVRYSGGIKLGTGGLVKAYGGGVKQALEVLQTQLKVEKQIFTLDCSYSQWEQIQYWLAQEDGEIVNAEYTQSVQLQLALSVTNSENLNTRLRDMQLSLKALKS